MTLQTTNNENDVDINRKTADGPGCATTRRQTALAMLGAAAVPTAGFRSSAPASYGEDHSHAFKFTFDEDRY